MRRENSTNKRPVVVVLMVLAAIFLFVCPAWAGGDNIAVFTIGKTSYLLNGVTFDMDVAPYIKDGRTYIPLRYVAKAMGITDENIIWDPKMKKVMIVKENQVVQLIIGSNELTINGKVVVMDVAPEVIAGRVMLPIRWLAHSLGVSIEWDSVSKTITVGGSNETAKAGTLSGDNGQEKALEKPVVDYKAILKEYKWYDKENNEWIWRVPVPEEMYQYYRSQPRIHERILKEYIEQVNNLRRRAEELRSYMEYWYQRCRILPGDSYYEAWQKYQTYMSAYNQAQSELKRILSEYQRLQWLYQAAEYRQIRDGYIPYVTEEGNYELVSTLAGVLAEKAPQNPEERIELAASFVQEAIPYVSEKGEYPKYPVETLVEGGDCEDKSILLAAILKAMGYKTALLVFRGNPGHMAIGVECPNCEGSYYLKDGVKYFYLETTSPGWAIGEVPSEHAGEGALVYVVP
ncbi:stalk domain-containing protein [Neomoorella humiferrea]|uniref:Copper amine oxidase-like N-terminal domain-containing protein n=1 Tax=Neomoorella humiferrea TaxID=676965 RepID=A0A2T0AKW2_9FIRM|nr:stalk domain-containing protein [Moorella humiferrea]PRR69205.1 hypothetical protein MOHU_25080 [Moorella humiferrea]